MKKRLMVFFLFFTGLQIAIGQVERTFVYSYDGRIIIGMDAILLIESDTFELKFSPGKLYFDTELDESKYSGRGLLILKFSDQDPLEEDIEVSIQVNLSWFNSDYLVIETFSPFQKSYRKKYNLSKKSGNIHYFEFGGTTVMYRDDQNCDW